MPLGKVKGGHVEVTPAELEGEGRPPQERVLKTVSILKVPQRIVIVSSVLGEAINLLLSPSIAKPLTICFESQLGVCLFNLIYYFIVCV